MPNFNLIDEPWIPCVLAANGSEQELGLRDALARAPEIREIVDPTPPVVVALHRLLLAILHRNLGPADAEAWQELWEQRRWDGTTLDRYFARWRERFDLFSAERPFYQDPRLDFQYAAPASKLTQEIASPGNPATLFDHTVDAAFTPAQAARYLVAHHAYTVGGLVTLERGRDPKKFKSADAGPLNRGAAALVKGQNLFETLMLNLHAYDGRELPFKVQSQDLPAWERDLPIPANERQPGGYLDLLTWQSRRIRLEPETDAAGQVRVRRVVIMKGEQFPDAFQRVDCETMLAFAKREKAGPGEDPWPAIAFREDRSLWRDSLVLFESVGGLRARPKTVNWLAELVLHEILERSRMLPLDLYGLSTDQAKVLFWRHERLRCRSGA